MWKEKRFSFLELLDISQSHTLFNYKAVNAEEKWWEYDKNHEQIILQGNDTDLCVPQQVHESSQNQKGEVPERLSA